MVMSGRIGARGVAFSISLAHVVGFGLIAIARLVNVVRKSEQSAGSNVRLNLVATLTVMGFGYRVSAFRLSAGRSRYMLDSGLSLWFR